MGVVTILRCVNVSDVQYTPVAICHLLDHGITLSILVSGWPRIGPRPPGYRSRPGGEEGRRGEREGGEGRRKGEEKGGKKRKGEEGRGKERKGEKGRKKEEGEEKEEERQEMEV